MYIITKIKDFLNEQNTEHNINENFWKWFNNSKIVDIKGNPLVVYHHSNKQFDTFKKSKGFNSNLLSGVEEVERHAYFFTDNIDFSKKYGKIKYETFLKVTNPFNFKEHYYYKNDYPQYSDTFDEFIEYVENNGIDLNYNNVTKSLNITPDYNWMFLDGNLGELFVTYLKSKNYDGVIFTEFTKEEYEKYSDEYLSIAVFNANQIKSTNNDGSWDINDDNIFS